MAVYQSPCKVNFILNILGRREDGFHDLETLFFPVPLYDRIEINLKEKDFGFSCNSDKIPNGSDNLVYRAAACFFQQSQIKPQGHIRLIKNLPSEAVLKAKSNLTLKRGAGGSFACLDGENRMSVYLDFSGATIDNKTEEDFIYYMTNTVREKERDANFAETWENEIKPQLTSTFISNANEDLGDEDYLLRLTSQQGSAYTLKVVVNSIDDNGNNECDYLIVNTMTGEVMAHIKMEAKGGRVGRYIGLLDDGFSAAGEDFGSELVDELDDLK